MRGATSVLKLTGKSAVRDVNINCGTGNNGLIMTHGGARVDSCQFVSEDLTSNGIMLELSNASFKKHAKFVDVHFLGNTTYSTALKIDGFAYSHFERFRIHSCKVGIHQEDISLDHNLFHKLDIGDCTVAIDIYEGNEAHFSECIFHLNTTNVSDDVGDHVYERITGAQDICECPPTLDGVTLTASADAKVWGNDIEIFADVSVDKPYRVVGYDIFDLSQAQKYDVRVTADDGATYFDHFMVESTKLVGASAASGTEAIFNIGQGIKGSIKSESAGSDTLAIRLRVQKI